MKHAPILAGCIAAALASSSFAAEPEAAEVLPADATQAQAPPPAQAETTPDDQQIKCRKVAVTGSLVKKGKVCKTVAEWDRLRENGNQRARDIVEVNRSGMTSN